MDYFYCIVIFRVVEVIKVVDFSRGCSGTLYVGLEFTDIYMPLPGNHNIWVVPHLLRVL